MPKEEKDLAKERVKVSKELVGKGTKRVMEKESDFEQDEQDIFNEQDINDFSNATTLSLELNVSPLPVEDYHTEETKTISATSAKKRRASCVPQLIDNKRKHRDKMLFEEAKDDAKFRKDLTQSLKDSLAIFAQGIQDVSKTILDMGAGLSRSNAMLSHGFSHGHPPHPVNKNMFYQYPVQYMPSHASNPCVYIPMSNETPRKVMQQDNGSDENMQD
ncbi:Hypothetical predicted protein [Paramuricea clavata]|uniref:Uncharacterized protein n=1 Tax=Paramuricea clavata TaxID=317549 RepID=A0A6S7KJ16_PARCT|nr:Hypothetical predicted protein [Paramuricea clavata]